MKAWSWGLEARTRSSAAVFTAARLSHGAGVVDEDAQRDGHIGVGEGDNVLRGVVLEDVEVVAGEVHDEVAAWSTTVQGRTTSSTSRVRV